MAQDFVEIVAEESEDFADLSLASELFAEKDIITSKIKVIGSSQVNNILQMSTNFRGSSIF